jgi:MSHA pilin protein MshC
MRALRTVAGFTLIELITVLILVGILAVTALPRMFDRNTFESRGFFDETKSILRYAQKSAIAQRRDVCVTFAGTGAALRIASASGAGAACDTALTLPSAPRGGNDLVASVAGFRFRAAGGTNQAANVTVTVAGANGTITVDRVTGHVE